MQYLDWSHVIHLTLVIWWQRLHHLSICIPKMQNMNENIDRREGTTGNNVIHDNYSIHDNRRNVIHNQISISAYRQASGLYSTGEITHRVLMFLTFCRYIHSVIGCDSNHANREYWYFSTFRYSPARCCRKCIVCISVINCNNVENLLSHYHTWMQVVDTFHTKIPPNQSKCDKEKSIWTFWPLALIKHTNIANVVWFHSFW